jgi:hypothetical protein
MAKSLRSQLYRGAGDLGNLQAARKGPASYGKRIVRRKVYRSTNRVTANFLRSLGLQGAGRPLAQSAGMESKWRDADRFQNGKSKLAT